MALEFTRLVNGTKLDEIQGQVDDLDSRVSTNETDISDIKTQLDNLPSGGGGGSAPTGNQFYITKKYYSKNNIATDFSELLSLAKANKLLDINITVSETISGQLGSNTTDGSLVIDYTNNTQTFTKSGGFSYPKGNYTFTFQYANDTYIYFIGRWVDRTDTLYLKNDGTSVLSSTKTVVDASNKKITFDKKGTYNIIGSTYVTGYYARYLEQ